MTRTATVAHLYRGDTITGIDGAATVAPETVTGLEFDTYADTVTVTTRCGPRRRIVRQLPASTPVTTDPPLPAWRFTDRRRETDWETIGANVGAFAAGVALGLSTTNRRR